MEGATEALDTTRETILQLWNEDSNCLIATTYNTVDQVASNATFYFFLQISLLSSISGFDLLQLCNPSD